jgi:UDP-N-acetylmuramyl pentapeptide synthase
MIEQGKSEELEHRDLAEMIIASGADRVITVGPRLQKYTVPMLRAHYAGTTGGGAERVAAFLMPGEAYNYLQKNIRGGETILFKGARYLEGIVEKMLLDPSESSKLCRREAVWVARRKQWGI